MGYFSVVRRFRSRSSWARGPRTIRFSSPSAQARARAEPRLARARMPASDTAGRGGNRPIPLIAEAKMKYARICLALAVIVAPSGVPGQAASEPNQAEMESANRLYEGGKFAEAGAISRESPLEIPGTMRPSSGLGRIACFPTGSRTRREWLEQAIALQPDDDDAKAMLAEAFYRRDDFQRAAAALKGVEVGSNKLIIEQYPALNVAKMESFNGQTPYEVHGNGRRQRAPNS